MEVKYDKGRINHLLYVQTYFMFGIYLWLFIYTTVL